MASFVEVHGQAGDERNFEALYRTYKSEVQRLASYLLKNRDDAEDASQTVFVNVLRALREGVTPADPRAWLLAITRNVCFSRKRAVSCRPDEVELDPETVGYAGGNGDDGPSADDIVGALARLVPNQRTALILRDFRGVPRAEISELLSISPTGVEALLTRARSSFREELEADAQPFDCAETRALVEQQLDGEITVAERHSLRTHLRHCSPCSTLARAVRSSRGKLASLLFWPVDLISRLVSACSQAPSAVHLAGAISSAAVVASVAIPAAIHYVPAAPHVEGRTAPAPVVALQRGSSTAVVSARRSGSQAPTHAVRAHKPAAHARAHAHIRAHAPVHVHAVRSAPHSAPSTTTSTSEQPAATATVTSQPAPTQSSTAWQPVAIAPRSSSPAWRPYVKAKPKSSYRAPVRRGSRRHAPMPPDEMPASTPPAATLPPSPYQATDGGGPSSSAGSSSTPAAIAATQVPSAAAGSSSNTANNSSDSSSSGKGHHKHK